MKLLSLIIASVLGISSLALAQEQSAALKDFVTTKTAEIIADERKILALKEAISKLQMNQELVKAFNLEENSRFLIAGGALTSGGSLLLDMVDFTTGNSGQLSNQVKKMANVGFKVGGTLLATGAVVFAANKIYINFTNTQIEHMKINITRVEGDLATRKNVLESILRNPNLK